MGETAGPYGDQHAQAIQVRMRSSNLGSTSSGLWARDAGKIINAKSAIATQDGDRTTVKLVDVRVYTFTPDGQVRVFSHGDSAIHDGNRWVMTNVRTTTLDAQGTHSSHEDTQTWASRLNPHVLEQSVIHPEYLSMADLRRNMRYLEANGQNPGAYAVAFWGRALFAVNTLVLVLCAMPFAVRLAPFGRLGQAPLHWHHPRDRLVTSCKAPWSTSAPYTACRRCWRTCLPTTLLVVGALAYFRRFG